MFHEYETFRLARPLASEAIPIGAVGVVLMVFGDSGHDYEVEFPDGKGGNLGTKPTFTISEDFMAPMDESPLDKSSLDKARLQPQRRDKSAEH